MSIVEDAPFEYRSRTWVATLWLHNAHSCLESKMNDLVDTGRIRFIGYGAEVCPETEALHYQAYLVFYQPQQASRCHTLFGEGHFFKPMRGTLKQNETYCSKEGSFTKLGDEPKQGERNDIIGFKRKLDMGEDPLVVAEEDLQFNTYVKYHAGMNQYAHHIRGKRIRTDRTMPKVYIRVGDAGSGKSQWLDEQFGLDGYREMPDPTSNWWITPAVSRSDTVVFNDVSDAQVPKITQFLKWTDRYPVEFNSKGGFLWWKPKNIVFTSNQSWTQWWPGISDAHKAAVERRIYCISLVFKDKPVEHFYPNGE